MKEEIGESAGKLWCAIGKEGKLPLSNLPKYAKGNRDVAYLALGWLAREDKVKFENSQDATLVSLTEKEEELFKKSKKCEGR